MIRAVALLLLLTLPGVAQAPERPQTTIATDDVRIEVYGTLRVDVVPNGAGWLVTVRP